MFEIIQRELIYLWYYFSIQFDQIFQYWLLGIFIGSFVSVFLKDWIHKVFLALNEKDIGVVGIIIASGLGILSPLCMYGTIPIAASFSKAGMKDDWLAAFMMSSILLNPQLIIYSGALGIQVMIIRIISSLLCGIGAGLLLKCFMNKDHFFNFEGLNPPTSRDVDPSLLKRYLKNVYRNIKSTGLYFLIGIMLSALFQRYVPVEVMTSLFGQNEAFGVLMAATIGVPLYACGGGTIPLLQQWLLDGMSIGSAASFMITGPATKITNLGALKIVLGMKHFVYYLVYVMGFSLITGLIINIFI